MPSAPAGETALGLKPDSASSWAASRPPETFQRAAARRIVARYVLGTKSGSPVEPDWPSEELAEAATPSAADEHGAGPCVKP